MLRIQHSFHWLLLDAGNELPVLAEATLPLAMEADLQVPLRFRRIGPEAGGAWESETKAFGTFLFPRGAISLL